MPADLRVATGAQLRVEEAALTGESLPVDKQTEALEAADLPLGDRTNMAYKGTTATYGRGSGLVVATGMDTEIGRIARMLPRRATPVSVEQQDAPVAKQPSS